MSLPRPGPDHPPEHPIDELVRTYLHRQAESVDAQAVLDGVRRAMHAPTSRVVPPRSRRLSRQALLLATAAGLIVAFFGGRYVEPAHASAEELLREARETHALRPDRCYRVQVVPEPGALLVRIPLLFGARETQLWTRGDRFWFKSTDPFRTWACGRDEEGSVWLAMGHHQGVRFDADEIPDRLALTCDVLGLRVETLLKELTVRFELSRSDDVSNSCYRVQAVLRAGVEPRSLRSAELEIDSNTRELRKLVLHRIRRGTPTATVTFTLTGEGTQADTAYRLDGHIDPDAPVFTLTNKPGQRNGLMNRALGQPGDETGAAGRVGGFALKDAHGGQHTADEWARCKAVVLFFIGTDCPVSNGYAPEMTRLAKKYADQGVIVWGVHPDPDVTPEGAAKHAGEYSLQFPIILDPQQRLARQVGVRITPEAAVLSPTGAVLYCGRIDDRYSTGGKRRVDATTKDLEDALKCVLAGGTVAVPRTRGYGCPLPEPAEDGNKKP
jgi:peroxiredoxin